jgi:hypothetical protein
VRKLPVGNVLGCKRKLVHVVRGRDVPGERGGIGVRRVHGGELLRDDGPDGGDG